MAVAAKDYARQDSDDEENDGGRKNRGSQKGKGGKGQRLAAKMVAILCEAIIDLIYILN